MKKFSSILFVFLLVFSAFSGFALNLSAASAVVYVKDGGTGNGSSASSPLGSLLDAYSTLGVNGGTIILTDITTVPNSGTNENNSENKTNGYFSEPVHTGKVVVTSLNASAPATLFFDVEKSTEYLLSGPTKFENLVISSGEVASSYNIIFEGRGNHLIMGEGLTMYDNGSIANFASTKVIVAGLCARGSEYDGFLDDVPHVTLYSGNYAIIATYTYYVNIDKGALSGDAFIDVLGDITVYEFSGQCHGDSNQTYTTGASIITLKGVITRNHFIFPGNNHTSAADNTTFLIYDGADIVDANGLTVTTINGLGKITTLRAYYEDNSISAQTLATFIGSSPLTKAGATSDFAKLSTYTGALPPAEVGLNGTSPSETTAASQTSTASQTSAAVTTAPATEASTQTSDCFVVISAAALTGLAAVIFISKRAKQE